MKYLVLVNPSSRGGTAGRRWRALAPRFPEAEAVMLDSIGQGVQLARTASGFQAVVACGGDGTVNAVAGGLMENPDVGICFGVIYMGTSPDFCRYHGIPVESAAALEVLRGGFSVEVPVLQANGHSFFCSCNLGMGADVASAANRFRPWLGDRLGTFAALAGCILRNGGYDFTVDGELLEGVNHMLFTRMEYIAGGLKLDLPGLKDDEYAMWLVRGKGALGWASLLLKSYMGRHCGEFRICRGRVRVESARATRLEYDGDPHGELPVEIGMAERRLRLLVPRR